MIICAVGGIELDEQLVVLITEDFLALLAARHTILLLCKVVSRISAATGGDRNVLFLSSEALNLAFFLEPSILLPIASNLST